MGRERKSKLADDCEVPSLIVDAISMPELVGLSLDGLLAKRFEESSRKLEEPISALQRASWPGRRPEVSVEPG